MTCGTKSNFTANGLQTLNGVRQVGVSLSKSCPKHFQAAKKPKGRGGEGGKENALLPVAGISTFKLYRRVGKCMYHFKGKRKFNCTVTFISLKTDLLANGGLALLASFSFWEAVSLLASFCGRGGGHIFLFIVHTVFLLGGGLGGLRARGCSARPTAISQEQRRFTCKPKQFDRDLFIFYSSFEGPTLQSCRLAPRGGWKPGSRSWKT